MKKETFAAALIIYVLLMAALILVWTFGGGAGAAINYNYDCAAETVLDSSETEPAAEEFEEFVVLDLFENAQTLTGTPAEILRGIAAAESHFRYWVTGDAGYSHGMFQLHSLWHDYRAAKWGEFDPFDPRDAAVIAGFILADNFAAFGGDWRNAIAAYRQGVRGVIRHGASDWYVERVLNWRDDAHKMMSFFAFMGITSP